MTTVSFHPIPSSIPLADQRAELARQVIGHVRSGLLRPWRGDYMSFPPTTSVQEFGYIREALFEKTPEGASGGCCCCVFGALFLTHLLSRESNRTFREYWETYPRFIGLADLLTHWVYLLFVVVGRFLNPGQLWLERISFALLWSIPVACVHSWSIRRIKRRVEHWVETGR